eukprot:958291-Amphidinium_carterae.1
MHLTHDFEVVSISSWQKARPVLVQVEGVKGKLYLLATRTLTTSPNSCLPAAWLPHQRIVCAPNQEPKPHNKALLFHNACSKKSGKSPTRAFAGGASLRGSPEMCDGPETELPHLKAAGSTKLMHVAMKHNLHLSINDC